MMSTFPSVLSSDTFWNPCPSFEGGFTPWDSHDRPFLFPPQEEPVLVNQPPPQEPINSNSSSDNPTPLTPNSCSDETNRNSCKTMSSGSEKTIRLGDTDNAIIDERKHRRMLSNRESARRSRMRKQKHLENLRNLGDRFTIGNRKLKNRVLLMTHQNQFVRRQNDHLLSEVFMLRQRLWDIRQVLLVRQLQQHLNPRMAMQ